MNATLLVKHSKPLFMLINIDINKTNNKSNKSRPQRTYFWICNVYLKQLLSFDFFLESFASYKLAKLKKLYFYS
jgi:hypothetical protein